MADFLFEDRKEAGERLADFLYEFEWSNPLIFGIPRGGVVVAAEVAKKLSAPLDIVVTRKLGVPQNPEFAFGAIAPGWVMVIDQKTVDSLGMAAREIYEVEQIEMSEMDRRLKQYRGREAYNPAEDRTAFIVDDGIATGATMRAAITFVKKLKPERVIVAAPVSVPNIKNQLRGADEFYTLFEPEDFMAVGQFYKLFPQVTDEEVTDLLKRK